MSSKQAKAPISAHPLFPAVVALWFAALFGLGSGVLPTVLFERIITLTHLAAVFPSATPPLGGTFRLLLSPVLALLGAVIGFVLARRLAAASYIERPASVVSQITPKTDPAPKKHAAADGQRRPISVQEELGNTRIDPFIAAEDDARSLPIPPRIAGRRRSLALSEDLPESEIVTQIPPVQIEAEPEQPFELDSFVAVEAEPIETAQIEPEPSLQPGLHRLRNISPFTAPLGDEGEPPLDLPPAFAERVEAAPAAATGPAPEPAQVFAAAARPKAPVLPTDPLANLSDLGMVQLAERLAASLRDRLAHPPAPPTLIAGLKADLGIEIAPATKLGTTDETVAPASAIFGGAAFAAPPEPAIAPMDIPAAMRPIPLDLDEDDEFDDIGGAEENYSSLLAMKSPVHTPAGLTEHESPAQARPFDAPAAPSAGPEPQPAGLNPQATEQALRSALAALQRVSGAA